MLENVVVLVKRLNKSQFWKVSCVVGGFNSYPVTLYVYCNYRYCSVK